MLRQLLVGMAVVLLAVSSATAGHVWVNQYNPASGLETPWTLEAGRTDQTIAIAATGGEGVVGLDLHLTLSGGPKITNIDLIGTGKGLVFEGTDGNRPYAGVPGRGPIYALGGSTATKNATGNLAILTLDTTGVAPGDYSLYLYADWSGLYYTQLARLNAGMPVVIGGPNGLGDLHAGLIRVVPEPTIPAMLVSAAAGFGLLTWRRRCTEAAANRRDAMTP